MTHSTPIRRAAHGAHWLALPLFAGLALAGCGGGGGGGGDGGGITTPPAPTAFTVGGSVTGLIASGLTLANAGTTTAVAANASTFTLTSSVSAGASYAVTIATQPTGETCTISNASGTASVNVTNVAVSCTPNPFTLGGTLAGIKFGGLVLGNGANTMTVAANAANFTLPGTVNFGSGYSVRVVTDPPGLSCGVTSGAGTMPAANVTNVAVTCSANTYTLGGTVAGVTGPGLVLLHNGVQLPVVAGSTAFSFGPVLTTGDAYAVTVQSSPAGLTCSPANNTGTTGTANIGNVVITCSPNSYTLGGGISGLTSAGLVLSNGAATLTVPANATSFTFAAPVAFSSSYSVTVQTQPTGRVCTVANGSGTMPAANVANVAITCTVGTYTISGTITGLVSPNLWLANGADLKPMATNATAFTMNNSVTYLSTYNITVQTQPTGLTCTVSNGSGTATANVTNVVVTCAPNAYTLGGTLSGLTTAGLVLTAGAGNNVTVPANATSFTLPTSIAFGSPYAVSVNTQPSGLTCTPSSATGTMPANNVTSVVITCAPRSFTLGGTISGLNAGGLVLANGANTTSVAANAASFTMSSSVAFGSPYSVTVQTQPTGLTCGVTSGSGTMPPNDVTSVQVACSVASVGWAWMRGPNVGWQSGVHGTLGVAAAGNDPGGRYETGYWKDSSGAFWLFGGYGLDAAGQFGQLNDVWKYNTGTNQWTWVGGSKLKDAAASFGTINVTDPSNNPGARQNPMLWADTAGNMYMFGGVVPGGFYTIRSDLWKYRADTGLWTWIKGPSTTHTIGTCGTLQVAAPGNQPGARRGAATWTDAAGDLWLFGGNGYDCVDSSSTHHLNDLWRYQPATGNWTWMGGSSTGNAAAVTGTQGVGSTGNIPGARQEMGTWIDASGNLWLWGGEGRYSGACSISGTGAYNDLWKYEPATKKWTWVTGDPFNAIGDPPSVSCVYGAQQLGIYGTQGVAAAGNTPGSRRGPQSWIDSTGTLWLMGGFYRSSTFVYYDFNDLWKFQPSTGLWTWVKGGNTPAAHNTNGGAGVYGTQGTAAAGNTPGARDWAATWVDSSGHLWMFGGLGHDSSGGYGQLNDMWRY